MLMMINKIHNLPNNVKKSVVDQIKLLSWAISGINGYFRHVFGDFGGALFVIAWWVIFQVFAHYLLYNTKNDKE